MKILKFKLFEATQKATKVDEFIVKRMNKAKSIGVIDDFSFDFDKMNLDIKLHNGKRIIKKLKIHPFLSRDWSKGHMVVKETPKYAFTNCYNDNRSNFTVGSQGDEEFWDEFNKIEKDFIKANRTTTITYKNKEYSIDQLYTELLPNSEIYQKILDHGYIDITTTNEKKNGTVVFSRPEGSLIFPTSNPPYKITKNGKIYRMASHSLTVQSFKPLVSLEDYEKCLNWIFDNVYKKETDKELEYWENEIKKNPKKLIKLSAKMPNYVSKKLLSPKLHNLKKIGLFDND